jgi:hypothetical protein
VSTVEESMWESLGAACKYSVSRMMRLLAKHPVGSKKPLDLTQRFDNEKHDTIFGRLLLQAKIRLVYPAVFTSHGMDFSIPASEVRSRALSGARALLSSGYDLDIPQIHAGSLLDRHKNNPRWQEGYILMDAACVIGSVELIELLWWAGVQVEPFGEVRAKFKCLFDRLNAAWLKEEAAMEAANNLKVVQEDVKTICDAMLRQWRAMASSSDPLLAQANLAVVCDVIRDSLASDPSLESLTRLSLDSGDDAHFDANRRLGKYLCDELKPYVAGVTCSSHGRDALKAEITQSCKSFIIQYKRDCNAADKIKDMQEDAKQAKVNSQQALDQAQQNAQIAQRQLAAQQQQTKVLAFGMATGFI